MANTPKPKVPTRAIGNMKKVSDVIKPKTTTRAVGSMRKLSDVVKPKATPKATAKAKPMTEAQKQAKAMDKLMAKRRAESKKTGSWPNYNTN